MSRDLIQKSVTALEWVNDNCPDEMPIVDAALFDLRDELAKPVEITEHKQAHQELTACALEATGKGLEVALSIFGEIADGKATIVRNAEGHPVVREAKPAAVTGSEHIVDANKMVPADFEWLRVVAVEAIRNVTGCPDVVGKDGACLTDELIRVAKLARLADFINSTPAPAVDEDLPDFLKPSEDELTLAALRKRAEGDAALRWLIEQYDQLDDERALKFADLYDRVNWDNQPVDVEAVREVIEKLRSACDDDIYVASVWADEIARAIGDAK